MNKKQILKDFREEAQKARIDCYECADGYDIEKLERFISTLIEQVRKDTIAELTANALDTHQPDYQGTARSTFSEELKK
jgi:hypothetical protein